MPLPARLALFLSIGLAVGCDTKDPAADDGGSPVPPDAELLDAEVMSGDSSSPADADGADAGTPDGGPPRECVAAADCQDGLFCNGYEACAASSCAAGVAPCTDGCDEATDSCTPLLCEAWCTATSCTDFRACNGVETCDAAHACQPGTAVTCPPRTHCLEPSGTCGCRVDADCTDATYCNGSERCASGRCVAGTNPCGARGCVEALGVCNCASTADCADDLHCNGVEYCRTDTRICDVLEITCTRSTCLEGLDRCGAACASDADCDDGRSCNGTEICSGGVCPGPRGCAVDADRDGSDSMATGGLDCDDDDPLRAPGSPEICDPDNRDEDCDSTTFGSRDTDTDGFIDATCCNVDATGATRCGDDCDDLRAAVHRTAPEVCNGIDDDCDGAIDDGTEVTQYRDRDGDGSGDGSCPDSRCVGAPGWVLVANDCDDTRSAIREGSSGCDPSGAGVQTCRGGAWESAACPVGTSCRAQPDGTGLCL